MLKINSIILMLLLSVAVFSCKDKDDEKEEETTPSYSFKNQNLSGKINGAQWDFIYGNADTYEMNGKTRISFSMYNAAVTNNDSCLSASSDEVFFTVDSLIGVQQFSMGSPATLFSEAGYNNYIVSTGAIEITEIDKVKKIIKGKLDAPYNDKSYVNGNFVVKYCE